MQQQADLGRHDRRKVAAAEAVHQVIDRGEARLLDDGPGGRQVASTRSGDQVLRDGVERSGRDGMEFGVQPGRGRPETARAPANSTRVGERRRACGT